MPRDKSINSVLIIGSGPIIIGQACEFDYSGSQASRSLREEGIEVTLINSNPATIMTDSVTADNIFLLPLEKKSIEHILSIHKIDAVLPTMGGQTALNLAIECEEAGIWEKYDVKMIGVNTDAINTTEDREKFRLKMKSIDINVCEGEVATSFLRGKEIAQKIGFPLVIRPSFTLGGSGGGFVEKEEDFDDALNNGLKFSPVHEVLVEKSILGWKEFELELLRDNIGNVIIICSIENFDAMGIHTGDSITVAPAMTLPDTVYQEMRNLAIKMMNGIGHFAGGCNVQFAIDPDTDELIAIEINPRVSRSSALASKATGYPIAKIAAKLAIGYNLDELDNQITKNTSAFFEPALDYVVVKIPRWNFDKFVGSDRRLGLQMKAVGEVMGIGSNFQEALQKACQSLEIKRNGLGADGREIIDQNTLLNSLKYPSWNRLFHIYDSFKLGLPFNTIQDITKIDKWFLYQIQELVMIEKNIENFDIETIPKSSLKLLKEKGYADRQIAHLLNCLESEVFEKRQELNIKRVFKLEKALKKTKEASIILYIIDLNVSNIKSIKSELESKFLKNKNVLIIGNKGDLKIKDDVKTYFKNKKHLIISGIKEKDILKLKKLIENYINLNLIREESSIMINERHYQLLKKVKNSLINVKNNIKNKSNTDLLAMDVKYALNYLGEITGEITNDEILGNIFSRFCIGK